MPGDRPRSSWTEEVEQQIYDRVADHEQTGTWRDRYGTETQFRNAFDEIQSPNS